MGSFNTVIFECPWCGFETYYQSKAGSCNLDEKSIHEADPEDAVDARKVTPTSGRGRGVRRFMKDSDSTFLGVFTGFVIGVLSAFGILMWLISRG